MHLHSAARSEVNNPIRATTVNYFSEPIQLNRLVVAKINAWRVIRTVEAQIENGVSLIYLAKVIVKKILEFTRCCDVPMQIVAIPQLSEQFQHGLNGSSILLFVPAICFQADDIFLLIGPSCHSNPSFSRIPKIHPCEDTNYPNINQKINALNGITRMICSFPQPVDFSAIFLALSQVPPALAMVRASSAQLKFPTFIRSRMAAALPRLRRVAAHAPSGLECRASSGSCRALERRNPSA